MTRKPDVMFDLGGTLLDLRPLLGAFAEVLVERTGVPPRHALRISRRCALETADALRRAQGRRFLPSHEISARVVARVLKDFDLRVAMKRSRTLVRKAWTTYTDRAELCADVDRRLLRSVRRASNAVGLLTDADVRDVGRILRGLRLRPYFDSVTISEEVGAYKPHPRIYEAALESLDAAPERTLFVSDSAADLRGAAALGIATAHVRRDFDTGGGRLPARTIRLRDLQEVRAIVRRFPHVGRFRRV
jgi:2-haloalkanoic acid dehalogenase type II